MSPTQPDQDEDERRRRARLELAQELAKQLSRAIGTDLQAEAALIALLTHAILMNQANDLLRTIQTKPAA